MNLQTNNLVNEEFFFISAIKHEIFSRIFSTIRHDVVGNISATLIRLSIIHRILKKQDLDSEKIKSEVQKLDQHLRFSITEIRDLAFWDFESNQSDYSAEILKKSILLMASQLAFAGIQLNLQNEEILKLNKIDSKSLLYTLMCIYCYFEDNDFNNYIFNIYDNSDSILITYEPRPNPIQTTLIKNRYININQEIVLKFAELNKFKILFSDKKITLYTNS